jgi:hypothetical protein
LRALAVISVKKGERMNGAECSHALEKEDAIITEAEYMNVPLCGIMIAAISLIHVI